MNSSSRGRELKDAADLTEQQSSASKTMPDTSGQMRGGKSDQSGRDL
jgi:hypothetical protein